MAKKKTNPLGQYGYPGNRSIRHQAKKLAAASVTPASEIRRQYKQSQADSSGFTQALIGLLGGQQSAYNSAADTGVSQQQAIDSAALSRLGGVDPTLVSGVQNATGALGDSAASRAVAQGVALKGYGAQQPGIAASRGALAQIGLTNAMQEALSQRRTALHQAFQQALPQVQQNALNMATAAANIDQNNKQLQLSYAQMAQSQSQFAASQAQQAAQFSSSQAEQIREFNLSRKDARAKAMADAGAAGFTPNEVQGFRGDIYDAIQTAKKGVPLTGKGGSQLHHGDTGKGRWKVPPAPNGALKEPNQQNSIWQLYKFLSSRYDPSLQPLILAELQLAYPPATWRAFKQSVGGKTQKQKPGGGHR